MLKASLRRRYEVVDRLDVEELQEMDVQQSQPQHAAPPPPLPLATRGDPFAFETDSPRVRRLLHERCIILATSRAAASRLRALTFGGC